MKRHNDYLSVYGVELSYLNHCVKRPLLIWNSFHYYLYHEREIIRVSLMIWRIAICILILKENQNPTLFQAVVLMLWVRLCMWYYLTLSLGQCKYKYELHVNALVMLQINMQTLVVHFFYNSPKKAKKIKWQFLFALHGMLVGWLLNCNIKYIFATP